MCVHVCVYVSVYVSVCVCVCVCAVVYKLFFCCHSSTVYFDYDWELIHSVLQALDVYNVLIDVSARENCLDHMPPLPKYTAHSTGLQVRFIVCKQAVCMCMCVCVCVCHVYNVPLLSIHVCVHVNVSACVLACVCMYVCICTCKCQACVFH